MAVTKRSAAKKIDGASVAPAKAVQPQTDLIPDDVSVAAPNGQDVVAIKAEIVADKAEDFRVADAPAAEQAVSYSDAAGFTSDMAPGNVLLAEAASVKSDASASGILKGSEAAAEEVSAVSARAVPPMYAAGGVVGAGALLALTGNDFNGGSDSPGVIELSASDANMIVHGKDSSNGGSVGLGSDAFRAVDILGGDHSTKVTNSGSINGSGNPKSGEFQITWTDAEGNGNGNGNDIVIRWDPPATGDENGNSANDYQVTLIQGEGVSALKTLQVENYLFEISYQDLGNSLVHISGITLIV